MKQKQSKITYIYIYIYIYIYTQKKLKQILPGFGVISETHAIA